LHYVPVQVDLSDLADSLTFFRGDINGEGGQDELAQKLAKAGRDWSLTFWRKEDMTAYMFRLDFFSKRWLVVDLISFEKRLFLEYARVMSPHREKMAYTLWESSY
jgi:hypothetical protein